MYTSLYPAPLTKRLIRVTACRTVGKMIELLAGKAGVLTGNLQYGVCTTPFLQIAIAANH